MVEFFRVLLYLPFLNLLMFFTWLTPGHFVAMGIILLTIVVRVILIVPTKKQTESQKRINQLSPLIADLKKEYGKDQQGFAVAQMELYKKNNINPFGSCFFTIIQLVVLVVLYNAIRNGIGGSASPDLYSWLPKVADPNVNFFWTNLLQSDKTYILPIIAAILQFWQMRMTLPKEVFMKGKEIDPQLDMQKKFMYIFPLLTIFWAGSFPAGVALYWVVNTLFSIAQQTVIFKHKIEVVGVEQVVEKADKQHPEFHRSEQKEAKLLAAAGAVESTSKAKGGVTIKVRSKS